MIKKILSATLTLGMLLAAGTPALAANGCQNFTTGPSSNNICNTVLSKLHSLNLSNSGSVSHVISQMSITGKNKTNTNTITGNIVAGDASAMVDSAAMLNTGNVTVNQTDPTGNATVDNIGSNNITGPSSNNTVGVVNSKSTSVNITNDGTVTQVVTAVANSGHNSANNNTIGGNIQTGNATTSSFVQTLMNSFTITVNQ